MCYVSGRNPSLWVFTNSWPTGLQSLPPNVCSDLFILQAKSLVQGHGTRHAARIWFSSSLRSVVSIVSHGLSMKLSCFCQGLDKWERFRSENTTPGEILHALESHWGELHRTTQNVLVTLYSAGRLRWDLESPSLTNSRMMQMLQVRDWMLGTAQVLTAPGVTKIGKGTFETFHSTALYKT